MTAAFRIRWPVFAAARLFIWTAGVVVCCILVSSCGLAEDVPPLRLVSSQRAVGVGIQESVLRRLAEDTRTKSNDVHKMILGSVVHGCQTTTTFTSLELIPGESCARMHLISRGQVATSTISNHPQARIQGTGSHSFEIVKPVEFDGRQFLTVPAYGLVLASETPRLVESRLGRQLPLFAGVADRIAFSEVVRRLPQTNIAVAEDVAEEVLRDVNAAVDDRLRTLNRQLQTLTDQVESRYALPTLDWSATTSSGTLRLIGQSSDEFPVSPDPRMMQFLTPTAAEDVVVVVSDELVNDVVQRLIPPDTVLSDSQLLATSQEQRPSRLDWQTLATLKPPQESEMLMFGIGVPSQDGVRLAFEGGRITARLKGRVVPRFGTAGEWFTSELVFSGRSGTNDYWVLGAELPEGSSPTATMTGTAAGTVVRTASQSFAALVDGLQITRWVDLPAPDGTTERLHLSRIDCESGLLRAGFRLDKSPESQQKPLQSE